ESSMSRGTIALPAALAAIAVSAALGAAIADLTRVELALARQRRAAVGALLAADGCLAEVIAGVAPGWDLTPLLVGPDGTAGPTVPRAPAGPVSRRRPPRRGATRGGGGRVRTW